MHILSSQPHFILILLSKSKTKDNIRVTLLISSSLMGISTKIKNQMYRKTTGYSFVCELVIARDKDRTEMSLLLSHTVSTVSPKKYSLESEFPLDEFLELVRPSTCGFDNFGVRVDQMIFDEVQACFNVSIFKLDEVQARGHLFLHRYFIEPVAGSLLRDRNTEDLLGYLRS